MIKTGIEQVAIDIMYATRECDSQRNYPILLCVFVFCGEHTGYTTERAKDAFQVVCGCFAWQIRHSNSMTVHLAFLTATACTATKY